jgi:rhodanese-related sulfurtransferase/glyoxylase-like metal-dependent hydrolase (beta-lactamase superfamily II)
MFYKGVNGRSQLTINGFKGLSSGKVGEKPLRYFLWFTVMCLLITSPGMAAIKDAESASHGTDASQYQIVDTYKFTGYELVQINLPVLSHYSYLLISNGETVIVDPGRDVQFYCDLIKEKSLSVSGVFLTHSHADFVAGHTELVNVFNCPIYQSAKSVAKYKIEAIADGTTLQIGKAFVGFLDTPGHVLDGTSATVGPAKDSPELILTGDFLFVGGVGRPDLVAGTTPSALAGMLFDAWAEKVSKLPDSVKVFPAHGAGSLCGVHLKDQPFSTIGEERTSNPTLQHKNKSEFITAVLSELQEPPQYFGHNAAMNRDGPPLVNWQEPVSTVAPDVALTDSSRYYLVDLRDSKSFAAGHVPNSVNIALRGRFESWTGIMVPWGSNIVVCGSADDLKEAAERLHRIGYTTKVLIFDGWVKAGLQLLTNKLVSPRELYDQMQSNTSPIIVDVRLPSEWMGLRIGTVLNLPLNKLSELSAKLDVSQSVVAVCNSAYRSSMAIGILERKGFKKATSLEGGSEAWIEAGLPVYGYEKGGSAAASAQIRKMIPLPERICARELKRLMMDLPGTFQIVDIRPAEMFADYSIPNSQNVDIAELASNPSFLVGTTPLIIVDRDGSYAMALGGIVSQKTQRPIKVLYEGLESYWMGSDLGGMSMPTGTPSEIRTTPAGSSAPPAAPSGPQPVTKKKSAGC